MRLRSRTLRSAATWSPPTGRLLDLGLHTRVVGDSDPTFLLLHGLAGSNRYFGATFDALAATGRVVAPDLLGFGQSPRPEDSAYDLEAHVSALDDLLERLAARRIWVVGHSAGALVALGLAQRWPDRVRHVFGLSPPLYPTSEAALAHIRALGLQVRLFASGGALSRAACHWMCRHREWAAGLFEWLSPDLPAPVARDAAQHTWPSYSRTLGNLILAPQTGSALARLAVPVSLLAGRDDAVLDLDWLRGLAGERSTIELHEWPGGHQLPLERPQAIVDWVRARVGGA